MVSSWPFCMTSTRRLANRRSSRSRTTWNSRSCRGSPPAMKCTDSALGGRSCLQRAAGRDERLRHHLAAERADRVLARVGADERVVVDLVEVENRQQLVEVCRSTLRGLLEVVLPDPVHVDQIGGAYCARRSACDDDHQVTALVAAQLEQRLVDLPDHAVGGLRCAAR